MTAPLFHLSPGALDGAGPGSVVQLEGSEGHHAATVMRLQAGEPIQLSDTAQHRATGTIQEVTGNQLSIQLEEVYQEAPQRPHLVLVQALAKDKRDLQAVESATELGVDRIIPWQAERSVARWKAGRETKKHSEWVNTVRAAAKQTRRAAIPEVEQLHTTGQYAAAVAEHPDIAVVVLHETEEATLAKAVESVPEAAELHLVVGPEGGISDREVQQLTEAGAQVARLGKNVLRSSTAGPSALAAVQLLLGRWD